MAAREILIVRLGAMGDIVHALPALASLRASFPDSRIRWVSAPQWLPLFEGNPQLDEVLTFRRGSLRDLLQSWSHLRPLRSDLAFDFQGLLKSALAGRAARPKEFWGWERSIAREHMASWFYTRRLAPKGPHRVDQNLQLVAAAGASRMLSDAWIPAGLPEGSLPEEPFVLASPFAGWAAKQWPLWSYARLAELLRPHGIPLVMNVAPAQTAALAAYPQLQSHSSSLAGLIYATRRALAVVGVDSGPMHLAAALHKPGVALFGPTDPLTHGPYGGTLSVLRVPNAPTTYKRDREIAASMREINPEAVLRALAPALAAAARL